MKLAEALALRADLVKRMAQIKDRIHENARIQEGDAPAEDPVELTREFEIMAAQLEKIIHAINRTNLQIQLPTGMTMTEALAKRDVLKLRIEFFRSTATKASGTTARVTRSEIKFVSKVDIKEFRETVDRLSKSYRELDTAIQGANWLNELVE